MADSNSIFITGGTSGIGLELAKKYLLEGARVGVCGRDTSKIPAELLELKKLECFEADVTDTAKMASVIMEFGKDGLDIIVANAGISLGNKSSVPDFSAGRSIIQINVLGVLNTFEPALNIMLEKKKGHLVAISSVAGFVGLPGASFYSSSKAAVTTLCESML